jgi:hypothetical protein
MFHLNQAGLVIDVIPVSKHALLENPGSVVEGPARGHPLLTCRGVTVGGRPDLAAESRMDSNRVVPDPD